MTNIRNKVVAIDMMGGDHGLEVTIPACLSFLKYHSDASLILVGDTALFKDDFSAYSKRVSFVHTDDWVAMDAEPAKALRHQKGSSIHMMAEQVKEGKAQAAVSAGNTGALVAIAKYILKTVPNIARPALMAQIPVKNDGHVWMVDLGANLSWEADQYLGFAALATQSLSQIKNPSIALLNIGTEMIKGPEVLKEANELLADFEDEYGFDYKGFIEPNHIYSGEYDIILCNGLMGNIALKTAEGTITFMGDYLKSQFKKTFLRKLIGLIAKPILRDVKNYFNPSKRNGALLLGLNGIVIKSHGGTTVKGFVHAIKCAYNQIK